MRQGSNRKRAFATQESRAQTQRMDRLGRSMLMLVATLISFGTIGLLAVDQLYRPDTFVISQLKIIGSFRFLKPQQIETVVNQQAVGNFFSIKLQDIKQRVENLPWVQSAEVRREWPNTLLINVAEQRPIMRWQSDRWVNSQGQVIDLPAQVSLANPVVLSGNEKDSQQIMQQAYTWKQRFLESGLDLIGLSLSDSHAYTVQLRYQPTDSEFGLLLGRDHIEQRLSRFLILFDRQYKQSNQRLLRVDARYPDGLAVKSELVKQLASALDVVAIHESDGFRTR